MEQTILRIMFSLSYHYMIILDHKD